MLFRLLKGGVAVLKDNFLTFFWLCGSFGVHGEGELDEIWDLVEMLGGIVKMLSSFVLFSVS